MPDDNRRHPACAALPALSHVAYNELVEDIRANGLLLPIQCMPDTTILDGYNRENACRDAGVVARYEIYTGDDPWGFVASLNLKRRQLTHKQKREFVRQMLLAHPQRPNTAIAADAQVGSDTVRRIRQTQQNEIDADNSQEVTRQFRNAESADNPLITTSAGVQRRSRNRRRPTVELTPVQQAVQSRPWVLDPETGRVVDFGDNAADGLVPAHLAPPLEGYDTNPIPLRIENDCEQMASDAAQKAEECIALWDTLEGRAGELLRNLMVDAALRAHQAWLTVANHVRGEQGGQEAERVRLRAIDS